jgi:hypothetical protein
MGEMSIGKLYKDLRIKLLKLCILPKSRAPGPWARGQKKFVQNDERAVSPPLSILVHGFYHHARHFLLRVILVEHATG